MKLVIELPADFVSRVQQLLKIALIPSSQIPVILEKSVTGEEWCLDPDLWISHHVYPERTTALEAVRRLFDAQPYRREQEVCYREGSDLKSIILVNPHPAEVSNRRMRTSKRIFMNLESLSPERVMLPSKPCRAA